MKRPKYSATSAWALCPLVMVCFVCAAPGRAQQSTAASEQQRVEKDILAEVARQRQAKVRELSGKLAAGDDGQKRIALGQLLDMNLSPAEGMPIFLANVENTSPAVQQGVVRALGSYGAQAREAIPALIQRLRDPRAEDYVHAEAASSLGAIGASTPSVVTALTDVLKDSATVFSVRLAVIDALGRLGPSASAAAPTLAEQLNDSMTEIQCRAFVALGSMEAGPPEVALTTNQTALDKAPPGKSALAFRGLEKAGRSQRTAAPVLAGIAIQDTHRYLRCAALTALGSAGPGEPESIKALLDTVAGRDDYLRSLSEDSLAKIGPQDTAAVIPLASALASLQVAVRRDAAGALAHIGRNAGSATQALAEALKRSGPSTPVEEVGAYLNALSAIGPNAREAGETVVVALKPGSRVLASRPEDYNSLLRAQLFVVLADIGVPESAHSLILDALRGNDDYQFAGAARASGTWGAGAKSAVPLLMRVLQPSYVDGYIWLSFLMETSPRLEAIRALGKIGPAAAAATPLLEQIANQSAKVLPYDKEARTALESIRRR